MAWSAWGSLPRLKPSTGLKLPGATFTTPVLCGAHQTGRLSRFVLLHCSLSTSSAAFTKWSSSCRKEQVDLSASAGRIACARLHSHSKFQPLQGENALGSRPGLAFKGEPQMLGSSVTIASGERYGLCALGERGAGFAGDTWQGEKALRYGG